MTRYAGKIGLKADPVETEPGVYKEVINEVDFVGDIWLSPLRWSGSELVQDTITANHKISVIGTDEMFADFSDAVYVLWQNKKWVATSIEYIRPRINLVLGKLYNG